MRIGLILKIPVYLTDVIFYKEGYLLALDTDSQAYLIDFRSHCLASPQSRLKVVETQLRSYIVESSFGAVLRIKRICIPRRFLNRKNTVAFKIYILKIDPIQGPEWNYGNPDVYMWDGIFNIGDDAVFLGDNNSVCVKASSIPGCKPNCIYFTDDDTVDPEGFKVPPLDVGVFDLGDQTIRQYYKPDPSKLDTPVPFGSF